VFESVDSVEGRVLYSLSIQHELVYSLSQT